MPAFHDFRREPYCRQGENGQTEDLRIGSMKQSLDPLSVAVKVSKKNYQAPNPLARGTSNIDLIAFRVLSVSSM